ncbi:hypothetical protein [Hydrogenophaga sp.]|uniref:hypothetical protein n=1 Tax=Hydrogenophaga sp. TaxID=1904254 RepID=UPI0027253E1F|nr:hypothetical protein [Hydrogenophaga sp.]MDO9434415.1 hypothetical protein [Hydrogenophaga sp.]
MKTSRLLTTTMAALTVVGAGLVYAQTSPGTPAGTQPEPANQSQMGTPPATGGGMQTQNTPTTPGMGTTPAQDTTQRSPAPMTTAPAQADRN